MKPILKKRKRCELNANARHVVQKASTLEKFAKMPLTVKISIFNFINFSLEDSLQLFFLLEINKFTFLSEAELFQYIDMYRPKLRPFLSKKNVIKKLASLRFLYKAFYSKNVSKLKKRIEDDKKSSEEFTMPRSYNHFDFTNLMIKNMRKRLFRTPLSDTFINRGERLAFFELGLENLVNIINFFSKRHQLGEIYIKSSKGMDYLDKIEHEYFDEASITGFKRRFDRFYRFFHTQMEAAKNQSNFRRSVTRFSYIPFRKLKNAIVLKANPQKSFCSMYKDSKILLYHFGVEEDTHGLVFNKEFFFEDGWNLMGGPCDSGQYFILHNIRAVPGAKKIKKGLYLGGSVLEYLLAMWDVFKLSSEKEKGRVNWVSSMNHLQTGGDQVMDTETLGAEDAEIRPEDTQLNREGCINENIAYSIEQVEAVSKDKLNSFMKFLQNVKLSDFFQFKTLSAPKTPNLDHSAGKKLEFQSLKMIQNLNSKVLKRVERQSIVSEYHAADYIEDAKLKFSFEERIRNLQKSKENVCLTMQSQLGLGQSHRGIQGIPFDSILNQVFFSAIERNSLLSASDVLSRCGFIL